MPRGPPEPKRGCSMACALVPGSSSPLTTPNPILNPTLILTLTLTLLQARPAERGLQLSGVPGAYRGGYPPLCHRVVIES